MSRALEQATGGGAPQPADSTAEARRIALDGQAYTWPEYVEAYGDDAQRCWDDAYDREVAAEGSPHTRGEPQPTAAIDEGTPHEDAICWI